MIVNTESADKGTLRIGDTVKLGYVDQERELPADKNVWEVISDEHEFIKLGDREVPSRAYVSRFNFNGSDQQKRVGDLSGGERNRVHLARVLKEGANFLLLDEPTNDLDVNTLRALEEALYEFGGTALVVSHDAGFSIASPLISSLSKAIAKSCGSTGITPTTRLTESGAWERKPTALTRSATKNFPRAKEPLQRRGSDKSQAHASSTDGARCLPSGSRAWRSSRRRVV